MDQALSGDCRPTLTESNTHQPEAAEVEEDELHVAGGVRRQHQLVKDVHQVSVQVFSLLHVQRAWWGGGGAINIVSKRGSVAFKWQRHWLYNSRKQSISSYGPALLLNIKQTSHFTHLFPILFRVYSYAVLRPSVRNYEVKVVIKLTGCVQTFD